MKPLPDKANSIKNLEDIKKIKQYFKSKDSFVYDRYLLYFTLGLNICLKPKHLIALKWSDIIELHHNYQIKNYIVINGFQFYLNNNCKNALLAFMRKYDNYKHHVYMFGNDNPMTIQAINYCFGYVEKYLNLNYSFSALSLHKTFVYWQLYYCHFDYDRMSKLHNILYNDGKRGINAYAEYGIDNDKIYVNDINL